MVSRRQSVGVELRRGCARDPKTATRSVRGTWLLFTFAAFAMVLTSGRAGAVEQAGTGAASGLPVPRFVSLKSDRVNVRGGPTKDHDVTWIFTRSGLPVEVTAEFDNWRRIRDWEGSEGWVYHSLLSGRRTALVSAKLKSKGELLALYGSADPKSSIVARLEPGVVGTVKKCTDGWCRVVGSGFDGYIQQERLWGVYPGEKVE
jgi:SH3-like domain-containing protein